MPVEIAPLGSLSAEESAQFAGAILQGVALHPRNKHSFATSELFDEVVQRTSLSGARDKVVGDCRWSKGVKMCDLMEKQGLLYGDGMGSYRTTPLGARLGAEQGVAAAVALAVAHPWLPPQPAPPSLTLLKLKSWVSGFRAGASADEAPAPAKTPPTPKA